jgi:hypothetical protein
MEAPQEPRLLLEVSPGGVVRGIEQHARDEKRKRKFGRYSDRGCTRHKRKDRVSPTLEVMVTVDPVTMQKRFDPGTDLTLIDPAL